MRSRQVLGQKACAKPAQLCIELGKHARDSEYILPAQQAYGHAAATLHGIGHSHHPMIEQHCIRDGLCSARQRVVGCHGIHKAKLAQRLALQAMPA